MHLTFCELILKDSVGKGATQCTFDELINKRPGSIIRDVRVGNMPLALLPVSFPRVEPLQPDHLQDGLIF